MSFNVSAEAPEPGRRVRDGLQPHQSNGPRPQVQTVDAPAAYGAFGACACGYALAAGVRFCQNCGRATITPPIADARPEPAKVGFPAWGIASIICSLVALLLVPILFGALGILFGFFAWRENRGVGAVLMIAGGVSIVAGMAIAIALMEAGAY